MTTVSRSTSRPNWTSKTPEPIHEQSGIWTAPDSTTWKTAATDSANEAATANRVGRWLRSRSQRPRTPARREARRGRTGIAIRASVMGGPGNSLSERLEVVLTGDPGVRDEHDPRVPLEQHPQAGQDRLP